VHDDFFGFCDFVDEVLVVEAVVNSKILRVSVIGLEAEVKKAGKDKSSLF